MGSGRWAVAQAAEEGEDGQRCQGRVERSQHCAGDLNVQQEAPQPDQRTERKAQADDVGEAFGQG